MKQHRNETSHRPTLPQPIKSNNGNIVGVHVPIIEKDIYFNEFSPEELTWRNAVSFAQAMGRRLPTLQEAHVILYFIEQLKAIEPDIFLGQFWTGTELHEGNCNAWFFEDGGCVNCISKQVAFNVLLIADPAEE